MIVQYLGMYFYLFILLIYLEHTFYIPINRFMYAYIPVVNFLKTTLNKSFFGFIKRF